MCRVAGHLKSFAYAEAAEAALRSCKPRLLCANGEKRPTLIFTDASWESGDGGLGAAMIDMATGEAMVYCGELPSVLKDSWVDQLGEHIICQLELYVIVAIRWCRTERLSGGRVIWWVDNEAARYAFILGQDLSRSMNLLVREFYDADSELFHEHDRLLFAKGPK